MVIGVPKETAEGEGRVALVPEAVKRLVAKGHEVVVESQAGQAALVPDELYADAGAIIGSPQAADDESGAVAPDFDDEIISGACVVRQGPLLSQIPSQPVEASTVQAAAT
jgi:NAD(P) transhydrogenase subunit alpha